VTIKAEQQKRKTHFNYIIKNEEKKEREEERLSLK
jgi:hypothetical protein